MIRICQNPEGGSLLDPTTWKIEPGGLPLNSRSWGRVSEFQANLGYGETLLRKQGMHACMHSEWGNTSSP